MMKLLPTLSAVAIAARPFHSPPANAAIEPYCYDACPEVGLEPHCCRRVMHNPEGGMRAKKCRAYPKSHRSFEDFELACERVGWGVALCCAAKPKYERQYMCVEAVGLGTGGPRAGLEVPEEGEGEPGEEEEVVAEDTAKGEEGEAAAEDTAKGEEEEVAAEESAKGEEGEVAGDEAVKGDAEEDRPKDDKQKERQPEEGKPSDHKPERGRPDKDLSKDDKPEDDKSVKGQTKDNTPEDDGATDSTQKADGVEGDKSDDSDTGDDRPKGGSGGDEPKDGEKKEKKPVK